MSEIMTIQKLNVVLACEHMWFAQMLFLYGLVDWASMRIFIAFVSKDSGQSHRKATQVKLHHAQVRAYYF